MAKQMKKYMAVTTASFMAVQLAACGNSETQTVASSTSTPVTEDQGQGNTNEEIVSVYNSEMADACDEWQEGDDGSYECLDENSPYYAQHFFNGLMYATAGAMIGSAIYKSRNLKNGTDRNEQNGGGSAVPRSTQSGNANNKSTNGITNSSQNKAGTTSNGSNTYSSGQRSYSTDSSSKSTNSYSNSSSSSTGKSGFGSGGASRGGSSSS